MVSDQNYFSSSLFLQRDLPNGDENDVSISRKQKVKHSNKRKIYIPPTEQKKVSS